MPANTVMLSAMMRELSARPGFTEAFLRQVEGPQKKAGAALLTPALVHQMRDRILGGDWQGLDRFPGWTMREINPTVRVVGHVAGKDTKVEDSATAGGAPSGVPASGKTVAAFLDLGDLGPEKAGSVSLDAPSKGKGFVTSEYVSSLGDGVTRGDGPNADRAARHADSARLAEVLNRLSLNGEPGVAPFAAEVGGDRSVTPEALVRALEATGHTVTVADSRYFANFGHLHYGAEDVMMPFWVNTQIVVPETKRGLFGKGRPLLVPVSHAEYEWFVRGPEVNAEVSFYFGIDGKAEWRTMDQQDQPWVMNHHAHEYRGGDAVEVTRLSGALLRTYMHLHGAHPAMPFGGYYGLGVCQDVVAAVELKLTGKTTLFPNTADANFFTDPKDAEVNDLIRRIPKDRDGKAPEPERIFGSLPVGTSDAELAAVSIPGLGGDLVAAHDAWTAGTLERVETGWRRWVRLLWVPGVLVLAALFWRRKRRV